MLGKPTHYDYSTDIAAQARSLAGQQVRQVQDLGPKSKSPLSLQLPLQL